MWQSHQVIVSAEPDTDLEDDGEAGQPTTLGDMSAAYSEDSEPSLGAPEQHPDDFIVVDGRCVALEPDQTHWAAGNRDDREGDLADTANDREHDECDRGEPWLGAPEGVNDREYDPAECGIADDDGLNEQMVIR